MLFLLRFPIFLTFLIFISCQTAKEIKTLDPTELIVTGPIEVTEYKTKQSDEKTCSITGQLKHEYQGELVYANIELLGTDLKTNSNEEGDFELKQISPGDYVLQITEDNIDPCTIQVSLKQGEQIHFTAILAQYSDVQDLKPIIYLYPEKEMKVHVELDYAGKLTTTYPKYPEGGWDMTVFPNGTLLDQENKEYYALYWEGEPRKVDPIRTGFVVPREETISFLEEKLTLLGLNARESNEFIIYWLPILEKNKFNLIHFAEKEYHERAKLRISPQPEALIRISMIFRGLDEEIEIPSQDLSSHATTRRGFTVVEWGGQKLAERINL